MGLYVRFLKPHIFLFSLSKIPFLILLWGVFFWVSPVRATDGMCTAQRLAVPLDDAASALAEQRPKDAANILHNTLEACPSDPTVSGNYHARLHIAALAALAHHRAGNDATCRKIISNVELRYLYGAAGLEALDQATVVALDTTPKEILSLLFQAVALCPGEQRVCTEAVWSNTRQRAGDLLKQKDYMQALDIFFEALARCAADPLDDQAYNSYAWTVSDTAFTAFKIGNTQACRDLLRRDPGLRHVLNEATTEDKKVETTSEFISGVSNFSNKLKKALQYNAEQCKR